jgi:hypothetical protein
MKEDTIKNVTASLQEKYPEVGIRKIEVSEDGTSSFYLDPTKKSLAFLDKGKAMVPHIFRESAATVTRDAINRATLDLAVSKDPYTDTAENLFKRADKYYYTDPLVGTVVNILANLSAKGFENDIDDHNVKQFYDTWAFDVNLIEVLEWIFLDFFKIGHVTTYKVLAKYEPRVSYLSPIPGKKLSKPTNKSKATGKKLRELAEHEVEKVLQAFREQAKELGKTDEEIIELEIAAKKNIWSKGHLPVAYTVLNPQLVNVTGNLLFDKTSITLRPPPELTTLLKKPTAEQTEDERALIKALPSDLKKIAESGGEYPLDSRLVGTITYKKQPYERYAKPRATRVFDSLEYKQALKNADLSTLDGISNYILKITIGSDDYPVTTQEELEAVAQLFNTPSKSFDVVWNHTLNIEKIVSPEIEAILGQDKYIQVNEDISGGLAMSRALIDGISDLNVAEAGLVIKGLMEEINYARRQVTRWIYREYQQIAEAAGFDSFPKVRWDEGVLQDVILYMNTLSQLVDRRMLSYRTALEGLGFDFPNEHKNMEEEMPIVQKGTFGIIGSPWQQAKAGPAGGGGGVQPVQKAPTGTPSSGRPKGQPAKKKTPEPVPTAKTPKPKKATSGQTIGNMVKGMTEEEFLDFKYELEKSRLDK